MSSYTRFGPPQAARVSTLLRSNQHRLRPLSSQLSPLISQPRRLTPQPIISQRRPFHSELVNTAVGATQTALLSFHSVVGPWSLTIPLIALTVNILFRLPWTAYTQIIVRRRERVSPVLQAWNVRIRADLSKRRIPPGRVVIEHKDRHAKVTKRIYKELGLQNWRLYLTMLNIPFFVLGLDGMRRLCGGPTGLLGKLFTGGVDVSKTTTTTNDAASAAKITTEATKAGEDSAATLVDSTAETATEVVSGATNSGIEPSLMTEGMLWFPDLTAADPYAIVPMALSAMLVLNMLPKTKERRDILFSLPASPPPGLDGIAAPGITQKDEKPSWRRAIPRGLIILAGLIGPLTMNMPVALHLYWLSSSAVNFGLGKLLNWYLPIGKGAVRRCAGTEGFFILPKRSKKTEGRECT
ncbi:uncharacterized protein BCR38DRAFT_443539 [Pseudomassariella vexata]|uniref:60Kd inner membrane protein-domain-containing protein n=1 Tax=Pseudomassariella vexata TaxID=1141098 RepID=A0A1Y2DMX6_9PEZI|nr:uncharacterized protein BCR38DRAFT_443539 [Pseudomassariella vexata]ORY59995.1 hypothetical protein BCR38DRAFT_443539 [Pseudomassariella vexata]